MHPDAASGDAGFDDLLQVLGEQLGEATQNADPRSRRKLKNVTFEYEPDHTAVQTWPETPAKAWPRTGSPNRRPSATSSRFCAS